jgi:hypothetical protein
MFENRPVAELVLPRIADSLRQGFLLLPNPDAFGLLFWKTESGGKRRQTHSRFVWENGDFVTERCPRPDGTRLAVTSLLRLQRMTSQKRYVVTNAVEMEAGVCGLQEKCGRTVCVRSRMNFRPTHIRLSLESHNVTAVTSYGSRRIYELAVRAIHSCCWVNSWQSIMTRQGPYQMAIAVGIPVPWYPAEGVLGR